ncbi:MAG: type VI secretion system lipoprotein TssJ [Gammaproteobacteria bacterium]|nr:type VI secretion system lipoprotein TssJ [Gammaproteobacteria bacterium]
MLTTQAIFRAIIGSLLIISLASCGALGFGPKPTRLEVSIEASPNLNPNSEGRPSPIVMRFYELSSADVFETSDFFTLYDSEMATLGKFILFRDEMNIKPGQLKTFKREAKPETQYIGVIAAYRDLDNARWRGILEVKPNEKSKIMIHLGSLSVSVTEVGKKR